ncbi:MULTISPECIES: universal stress protein [Natrialba]|uniref:UspA domain protein n=1 Tax=Natrialba aegyptia DSM 13077 TaxID=1227491 RepID=M0AMQ2_9EURY|nr:MULTISPECIES: universal stress protein [Natrialba]ELY99611.1 uspA domain protein [Natrialba aegyptia DSM 13077]
MSILAAVDATSEHDSVVEIGYDLASAYETELSVLHVVSQEAFESRKAAVERVSDVQGYSKPQRADAAANVANKVVVETLENSDRETISTVGRVGEPVPSILDVAADIDAEYIVIGGRKRSPTGKALFGSTTQSVLLEADRPVVTVMSDTGE